MILYINLFISFLIPLLAGMFFLSTLLKKNDIPYYAFYALSFLLGLGVLTQIMLVVGILSLPLGRLTITLPMIVFITLFYFLSQPHGKRIQKPLFKNSRHETSIKNILFLLFIAYSLTYILLRLYFIFQCTWIIPVDNFDPIATSVLKAKVFFFNNALILNLPHPSYPLHIPLTQSWVAFNLGFWDNIGVKFLIPFFCMSFVLIQYYFVQRITSHFWSLLSIVICISSFQFMLFSATSYRDIPIMIYICTSIMLLLLWHKEQTDNYLIVAGLFAGFASFTKLEGVLYVCIISLLLGIMLFDLRPLSLRDYFKKYTKFLIPSFGILIMYYTYNILTLKSRPEKSGFDFSIDIFDRLFHIMMAFKEYFFLSWCFNTVWFLLIITLWVNLRRLRNKYVLYLTLALIFFIGSLTLVSLFTTNYYWIIEKSRDTLPRMILHFFPLAAILLVFLNAKETDVDIE